MGAVVSPFSKSQFFERAAEPHFNGTRHICQQSYWNTAKAVMRVTQHTDNGDLAKRGHVKLGKSTHISRCEMRSDGVLKCHDGDEVVPTSILVQLKQCLMARLQETGMAGKEGIFAHPAGSPAGQQPVPVQPVAGVTRHEIRNDDRAPVGHHQIIDHNRIDTGSGGDGHRTAGSVNLDAVVP
ncbi:hypothetical protein KB221_03565 [Aquidulcibacter paucihalophilus]|nr:hypothetical protein KB221_03565 [Aquidulcibacter paucihalophilus]